MVLGPMFSPDSSPPSKRLSTTSPRSPSTLVGNLVVLLLPVPSMRTRRRLRWSTRWLLLHPRDSKQAWCECGEGKAFVVVEWYNGEGGREREHVEEWSVLFLTLCTIWPLCNWIMVLFLSLYLCYCLLSVLSCFVYTDIRVSITMTYRLTSRKKKGREQLESLKNK